MSKSTAARASAPTSLQTDLRLGFIALNDAAPLVVAQEQGIFARHGLAVKLRRELGWATIRDKIAFGELDAAHAISTLLISARLGLDAPPSDCLTACVLSTGGNAITLSNRLWERGVRDAATLRDEIVRMRHERQLVLGVAAAHSTHLLHLCDWLKSGGVNPHRDVRIVVVPPAQVFRNLSAGTIDGYCVGEPWNSLAIQNGMGWCVATSAELHPNHPEKVLMVRADFAQRRHAEHLVLVTALVEACRLCDDPEFRPELAKLLARREYLNQPVKAIAAGLKGPVDLGYGRSAPADTFVRFGCDDLNNPTLERAQWLVDGCKTHGLLPPGLTVPPHLAREIFRPDLFAQAASRHQKPGKSAPAEK